MSVSVCCVLCVMFCVCVVVVVVVVGAGGEGRGGRRRETNRTIWLLVPSEVSLRRVETEQLYQVKANDWRHREHVVPDLFSNFKMGKIQGVLW